MEWLVYFPLWYYRNIIQFGQRNESKTLACQIVCEAVDDTTWKITLRDDVTFQNGKKMTAQSVIDSWNRTMEIIQD